MNFEVVLTTYLIPDCYEEPSGRPCGDLSLQIAAESSGSPFPDPPGAGVRESKEKELIHTIMKGL